MDDVSGLADKSNNFANFFNCFTKIQIYLPHTITDKLTSTFHTETFGGTDDSLNIKFF